MARRHKLSALAVLAACLVRQSSLVVSLFFAGWIVLDEWGGPPSPPAAPAPLWPRLAGHLLVVAGGGFALLVAGLLAMVALWHALPGRKHLYLLAFCTALFLLPHALVEVRYAIMPFFLADFVAGYTPPPAGPPGRVVPDALGHGGRVAAQRDLRALVRQEGGLQRPPGSLQRPFRRVGMALRS